MRRTACRPKRTARRFSPPKAAILCCRRQPKRRLCRQMAAFGGKGFNWIVRVFCFVRYFEVCRTSKLPEKGFNCCGAKLRLQCADSRFAKPRNSLRRGRFYVLFASCKKNQKARQRFANLWTPGTIQISARYMAFAKVTGFHHVTGCVGNCKLPGYLR